MAELDAIILALQFPRVSLRTSLPGLPARPGLYAIYGDNQAWTDLALGEGNQQLPLYVGKAEDSLVTRDLNTHFGNGRTGSSTARRSFAALLREKLALSGRPRNPSKPGYFSNFGLSPADDEKLTLWMRARLEIAAWPDDSFRSLADIEADVLRRWNPPINISGVNHRWRATLQAKRAVMAEQARAWRPTYANAEARSALTAERG